MVLGFLSQAFGFDRFGRTEGVSAFAAYHL